MTALGNEILAEALRTNLWGLVWCDGGGASGSMGRAYMARRGCTATRLDTQPSVEFHRRPLRPESSINTVRDGAR